MITHLNSLYTAHSRYQIKMILTRQEKEKMILDLYNQGKTYKEISEIVRVSPRDIKPVLAKAEKEREKELGITTQDREKDDTGNRQTQKAHILIMHIACFQRVNLH